jgi:hypothetical protein
MSTPHSSNPVFDALDNAPLDSTPETPEERAAIAAVNPNEKRSHAEIERALRAPAAE